MPHFPLRTTLAAALALAFQACSDESSTTPEPTLQPSLAGSWRFPKAGESDKDFRFTLKLGGGDSVLYRNYYDGIRGDSILGTWAMRMDTLVITLADSIYYPPPEPRPSTDAIAKLGDFSRTRTMKFIQVGSTLIDPIYHITLNKE
ncbi:MAG: hypothetical protein IPK50_23615 [Fibrobacterota bacterium]|nr:MAG: hypothetical protein IPK50_23615 [Fibrobacterota bacterium]